MFPPSSRVGCNGLIVRELLAGPRARARGDTWRFGFHLGDGGIPAIGHIRMHDDFNTSNRRVLAVPKLRQAILVMCCCPIPHEPGGHRNLDNVRVDAVQPHGAKPALKRGFTDLGAEAIENVFPFTLRLFAAPPVNRNPNLALSIVCICFTVVIRTHQRLHTPRLCAAFGDSTCFSPGQVALRVATLARCLQIEKQRSEV